MDLVGLFVSVFSGLVLGSIYALAATGLTLQWGILKTLNFSHGACITLGAYVSWFLHVALGLPYLVAFIGVVLAGFLAGVVLDRTVIASLRGKHGSGINIFISTIAVSTILGEAYLLLFGGRYKSLPPFLEGIIRFGALTVSMHKILILIIAPATLMIMWLFLTKTRMGTAVRAIAQDYTGAVLLGVNANKVFAYTLGVATALAAITGALLGPILFVSPEMGFDPLLKAFFIVILGGLGSIKGTIYAAFLIGLMEALISFFIGTFWASPSLFILIILILLIKPKGIFGST